MTMSQGVKKVLDVGQCNPDHASISRMLTSHFGADVTRAHGTEDAMAAMRDGVFNLVLVNRLYDADGREGMDLIRQIKSDATLNTTPVMLVSNYDEAQDAAVEAGAVRGFGKAAINDDVTLALLQPLFAE